MGAGGAIAGLHAIIEQTGRETVAIVGRERSEFLRGKGDVLNMVD